MLVSDQNTKLELRVENRTPIGVQGAGDFVLRSLLTTRIGKIAVSDFTASVHSWIDLGKFEEFLRNLTALEVSRQGSAEIESMSPGEFRLRFYANEERGSIAIEGEVGQHMPTSKRMNKVYFDIAIDPSALSATLEDLKQLLLGAK